MKNLLIYINPNKEFRDSQWGDESERLIKLQIDNSIELGWSVSDILLFTNFNWSYKGVNAKIVKDELYNYTSSKIDVIDYMFENGLIEDDIYWCHDIDAFQLEKLRITHSRKRIALCEYGPTKAKGGQSHRWQMGSFFFGNKTHDIFKLIKQKQREKNFDDEHAITWITPRISERLVKLNSTYNFGLRRRNIKAQYEITNLPIRVIHFHPYDRKWVYYMKALTPIEVAFGRGAVGKPLIDERFQRLLKEHGLIKKDVESITNNTLINKNNIAISGSHNGAVAIEKEGEIVGVIELERFLSSKNMGWWAYKYPANIENNNLWEELYRFIQKEYGISYFDTFYVDDRVKADGKNVTNLVPRGNTVVTNHHESHGYGTFYQSPFEKALVISFDGGGNDGCFNIYLADRNEGLTQLYKLDIDLGMGYSVFGRYLADIKIEEEKDIYLVYAGKIMGLCGYGEVREKWLPAFKTFYLSNPWGPSGIRGRVKTIIEPVVGEVFDENNRFYGKTAWDIAATSQRAFEDVFIELTKEVMNEHRDLPICITGGCAMNIILNTRIKNMGKEVFVAPNTNDCGLATGMLLKGMKPEYPVDVTYLGVPLLDRDSLAMYVENNKSYPLIDVAADLKDGSIIGLVNGKSEHGPRALGNRSILCSPLIPGMSSILNQKVKNREWFRPFAPVVRLEDVSKYFEWEGESRWMSFCPKVREEYRKILPAITHIDGTARVQTVTKEQNEFLYNLLTDFEKLTGIGVLLNTSFNVAGKPILSTCQEAFKVYNETNMDGLIVEKHYFKKTGI